MSIDAKHLKHPYAWIALGFGAGLLPKAPGTAGSLLAAILWWFLMADQPVLWQLGVIVGGFVLGVQASQWMITRTGIQDPGFIVWDEFIGQWLALLLLPKTLLWYAIGFALFRLFDIVKRGPVGWADRRFKGGFGVMFDDALAGVLAFVVAQGLLAIF
jgi:phosphatidylglycerophosphatase A